MKVTFLFLAVCVNCFVARAQDTLKQGMMHQYSIGIQTGQVNHITGADVMDGDQPFNVLHGNLNRFSMGMGMFFRWHANETFSLHARVSYSTRRYSLYDSVADPKIVEPSPNWTNITAKSYVVYNTYRMSNMLFGIGGGHEGHYGRFIVRAGGEIDFIAYSDVEVLTESRNYINFSSDTTATGGNFFHNQLISFHDFTVSPGLWAIGIVGHASLEYKVNPHLGIGASLYLGGFYCGTREKFWLQKVRNSSTSSNSNGIISETSFEDYNKYPYSVQQFDFSPLNGQINVVYYFGERYIHRAPF